MKSPDQHDNRPIPVNMQMSSRNTSQSQHESQSFSLPITGSITRATNARPARSLGDYLEVVKKRKLLGIAVFLAVAGSVIAYTLLVTPWYRSEAVLMVRVNNPGPVDSSTKTANENTFQRFVETEVGTLRSRYFTEQLVKKKNLVEKPEFIPLSYDISQWIMSQIYWLFPDSAPKDEDIERRTLNQVVVGEVYRHMSLQQVGKSQLLRVGMEASTAEESRMFLETFLDLYLERRLEIEQSQIRVALDWLKTELEKVRNALQESETALVKFVAEHGIAVSEDGGLSEVGAMIRRKKESLMKAQEMEARLKSLQTEDGQTSFNLRSAVTDDETLRRLKDTLATLETEYNHMAAAYAPDSPRAELLKKKIEVLRKRIATIQSRAIDAALVSARREGEILESSVAKAKEEALRVGSLDADYTILQKEVDINKELLKFLLKEYKEAHMNYRTSQSPVTIIDRPSLPLDPVWPKSTLFILIGITLGIMSGLSAIFSVQFIEDGRKDTHSVERDFGINRLGIIPDVSKLRRYHDLDGAQYEFLTYERPNSPVADSIRSIHASMVFSAMGRSQLKSVVVSSAVTGEGKTFVAVSLATALTCSSARLTNCGSKKILVVDCDMRRPRIQKVFGTYFNNTGLAILLSTQSSRPEDVIREHRVPGLYYMTAGPEVSDPTALLISDRFSVIVKRLYEMFDFIIFDSPPILGFPEIKIISPHTEGVLLVVEEGRTSQNELRIACSEVTSVQGGKILGLIKNKARPGRSQFIYGGHYYTRSGRRKYHG